MIGWYIIYALITLILGYTNFFGDDIRHFFLLTIWLCIFTLLEIRGLYQKRWPYFLINPILLTCFITFGLALGGITNFLQMKDGEFYFLEVGGKILSYERIWLKIAMAQVCLGALFMWVGYKSNWGVKMTHLILEKGRMKRFLGSNLAITRLMFLIIFAYLIKLYLFNVGLLGRVVDAKYFAPVTGYKLGSQIRILGDLSLVTFVFVCYLFFTQRNKRYTILFFLCLGLELFFAFLYGARGPFLTPFLIVFVTGYYATRKVSMINFLFIPVALYLAFTIVLEFKTYVLSPSFKRDSNPVTTIVNFLHFRENLPAAIKNDIYKNTGQNIKASTNAVANAAMAIRYSELYGLDDNDPSFIANILQAPYNAVVPKFLQPQNEFSWGYWFKNKVLHHNIQLKYSISITPVGFLYLAGGSVGVCLGFLIYGFLLRFTYSFLKYGILGFLTFIALTSVLYNFDSVFSGTLVNVIRYTLIYPIIFFLLFSKFRR